VFAKLFVYNILFEDSEVDEMFLEVDSKSRVLGIAGAGCGIANHLSRDAASVDAVDINGHHLAVTALKVSAAQRLSSYDEFYALLGRGEHPDPERVVGQLTRSLPPWAARYWRKEFDIFARSFYQHGLTSRLFAGLRQLAGVDADWLRTVMRLDEQARVRATEQLFHPMLSKRWLGLLLRSPLNLLALGVNFQQCARMLETEGADLIGFLKQHVARLATTDVQRNWFIWQTVAGHYNHDCPDAVPPYLRRDRHDRSTRAHTEVRLHRRNIFEILASAPRNSWTHYTLCDAPDWMPTSMQRKLFEEVLRTSADGAIVLYRTVEQESLIERLGLERSFLPMTQVTERASALDRTRQYRRVAFHRVAH